jgi:lipoprotein-anchoring transpeptidase ErfK/SrfK
VRSDIDPNPAPPPAPAGFQFRLLLILLPLAFLAWLGWRSVRTRPAPTRPATSAPGAAVPRATVPGAAAPGAAVSTPAPSPSVRTNILTGSKFSQEVLEIQLALVRHGISSGSLDGMLGSQTRAALRALQQQEGLRATGVPDAATRERLAGTTALYVTGAVTAEDLARLQPVGKTWLAKSQQDRLDFETLLELFAERAQAHPALLRRLNPGIDWTNAPPGTTIRIPNAEFPTVASRAAQLKIFVDSRMLEAFDGEGHLLAHFPCSIAQRVEKRPVGETLHVAVLVPNPNYTFDPEVFPESAEARELGRKLILPPGPNNPVGTVWIGLDKPGFGIHGTPRPEEVGRTESHGCFRLANWNAEFLLRWVWVGLPVLVEP